MSGDRPGKPPKPPLKTPKGNKQLGVAGFYKPSNRTASENKGRQQRHMQNVLQGTGQHRQNWKQQQ